MEAGVADMEKVCIKHSACLKKQEIAEITLTSGPDKPYKLLISGKSILAVQHNRYCEPTSEFSEKYPYQWSTLLLKWKKGRLPKNIDKLTGSTHESVLCAAAESVQIEIFSHLLRWGLDINAPRLDGWNPILLAVKHKCRQVVQFLLENNVELEYQSPDLGQTPFLLSVYTDQIECTEVLIQHGCNIRAKDYKRDCALMYTIYDENEDMMTLLLRHGCDTEVKNKRGDTPLLVALKCKSAHSVKKLLDYGCKVNATKMNRRSPLLQAVKTGSIHLMKLLIDGGAKLEYKGRDGKTALLLATKQCSPDIVTFLLNLGSNTEATCAKGWDALIYSIRRGSLPIVKLILGKHCSPNHRDTAGKTALIHAAECGNDPEVIRSLLKYGWNCNAKDSFDMNALLYATEKEKTETVKILLEHNCEIEHRKPSSRGTPAMTAFFIAFKNNDFDTALRLLQAGCTVNGSPYHDGVSPLLAAALTGSESWVHLLIKQDADVRHVDNKGRNALSFLKDGYDYDCTLFKILFAAGASIEDIDISEMPPDTITRAMIKLSKEKLSLQEQCRRKIREHLLSPFGGQQNNLYVAVEKLPLPGKMKRHLLFNVPLQINDQSVSYSFRPISWNLEGGLWGV